MKRQGNKLWQWHSIFVFIICIGLPFFVYAKILPPYEISGLSGNILTNTQNRLEELNKIKPLVSYTDDEIKGPIEKALYPYGYFRPKVRITSRSNGRLGLQIDPGPPLLVAQLSISLVGDGKNNLELKKSIGSFNIQEGGALDSIRYEAAKQQLLDSAEQQGYKDASYDKAQILVDKASYKANIYLVLNTGRQYFFGDVHFDPTYISPKILKRYVPFQPGAAFSNDRLLAFSDALSKSGYFKSVSVKPGEPIETYVPLDVHLEAAARINYSLGIGYGTDTGLRGQAGLHIQPVNPLGHKFNAVALGSFKENTLKSQYVIPGADPFVNQYEITGSFSTFDYKSGYSNSSLMSFAQRHTLPNFQSLLFINNLYEKFNYTSAPNYAGEYFSFFPEATLTWLHRSDPLFSPSGYTVTLDAFIANKSVLSEVNFSQVSLDAKAAWTLDPIRTRFFVHGIYGYTQTRNIYNFPLSLALLLGGADNLKAYDYNSIGPGKVINYAGIEIQKETKPKWYVIGFFDVGNVYDPTPSNRLADMGAGLLWVSPIGPIKVGLATPMDSHFTPNFKKIPQLIIKMGPDL